MEPALLPKLSELNQIYLLPPPIFCPMMLPNACHESLYTEEEIGKQEIKVW